MKTKDLPLASTTSINGSHLACRSHLTFTLTQTTWWRGTEGSEGWMWRNHIQPNHWQDGDLGLSLKETDYEHGMGLCEESIWFRGPSMAHQNDGRTLIARLDMSWSYMDSLPQLKSTRRTTSKDTTLDWRCYSLRCLDKTSSVIFWASRRFHYIFIHTCL